MALLARVDPIAAFLGRSQDHWLEQVVLPGLAAGFATAAMLLARSFVVFLGGVEAPSWIVIYGALVALAGTYSGNFLVRARAPFLTHVVEGAAIAVVGYTFLRLGGAAAPATFFSNESLSYPQVYLPLGIVLFGWYLAVSAGRRLARIGSVNRSVAEQAQEERAWVPQAITSPAALIEERRSVVWYFTRRTLGYTLLAGLFVGAAFDSDLVWEPGWMVWRWAVAAGMVGLLFCGLALQGCVFIYRLRESWVEAQISISPQFVEHWVKSTLILTSTVLLAALLLPSGFALFDFVTTAESLSVWFAWFLSQGVEIFNRYALQGARPSPTPVPSTQSGGGGFIEGASAFLTLLLAAVAVAATALVALGIIVLLLRGEWRKLSGILRLPVILIYWVRGILKHFRLFFAAAVAWLVRLLERVPGGGAREKDRARDRRRRSRKRDEEAEERLPAAYVRRLFVQLIRAAERHGVRLRPDQTPYEFAAWVKREFDGVDQELDLLADRYVEARYGRRLVEPSSRLEEAWRRVSDRLRRRPRETAGDPEN